MLGIYADSFLTAARVAPRRQVTFPEAPKGIVAKKDSVLARLVTTAKRALHRQNPPTCVVDGLQTRQ